MANQYPLAPNGVFWTVQGEGTLLGEPMAFLRLAGCSVGCPQCDTDYRVNRRCGAEEIVSLVQSVVPDTFQMPWVWITGGEPTDHNLAPLVDVLRTVGYRVALATSGVRAIDISLPVNWLSVSPHSASFAQRSGHEVKVVPGLNGLTWEDVSTLAHRALNFPYKWIQPLSQDAESHREAIDFVMRTPGWRLSPQAHKAWGLP